jgi:hypothetical protein
MGCDEFPLQKMLDLMCQFVDLRLQYVDLQPQYVELQPQIDDLLCQFDSLRGDRKGRGDRSDTALIQDSGTFVRLGLQAREQADFTLDSTD